MKYLFAIFLIGFSGLDIIAQTEEEMFQQAEKLQDNFKEAEALTIYKKILEEDPNNQEALNQASFLSSRIGFRKEGDVKIRYYKQGQEYAERSLEVNDNNAEANYVMGLAMGRIAEISPTKEKLEASKAIKEYSERALRLDRNHAPAWHLLGKWHYGVKELGATKMFLIKTIYGGLPSASYESAVACYNKAINLRPDYILYYLDLAKAHIALDREEDAKAVLEKALQKQPITPDDSNYLEECRELKSEL